MSRLTMFHLSIYILMTVINIRGENWYSATLSGHNTEFEPLTIMHSRPTFQSEEQSKGYVPTYANYEDGRKNIYQKINITTVQPDHKITKKEKVKFNQTTKITNPELHGSSLLYLDYYTAVRNNSHIPVEVINYDNTINVVNVVKRSRPKRKIIKRRCPTLPRRDRQLSLRKEPKIRFLDVFQVVEFEHIACISSSGLEGICLHEYECESNGGSTMGTCADGYGTCCVTQFLCDGQSSEAVGWFTNPNYPTPSTDRLTCTFTLSRASEDVKQIRLDFVTFELLGPTDGTCQQDQFVVSGQNINSLVPILCGINTGQHAYVEVSDVAGPIHLSIQTASSDSRLFAIKISQLTWADELAAPVGCLQYLTESEGYFESFNYRDKSEIGIARFPSYLNNLNYAICIRRAPETCSISYTNTDYMQIVNYDVDGLPVIPHGQAGVEIFNCPSDWLLMAAARLCGDRLNDGSVVQDFSLDSPVTDNNAGPIAVWFRSDEGYVGRGFRLKYQQNLCNAPA